MTTQRVTVFKPSWATDVELMDPNTDDAAVWFRDLQTIDADGAAVFVQLTQIASISGEDDDPLSLELWTDRVDCIRLTNSAQARALAAALMRAAEVLETAENLYP